MMTGASVAQGLVIISAPLLTRLYSPEAFGILALFLSISSIFAVVSSARYEMAIMLPGENHEAANIMVLATIIVCLLSGLSLLAVAFYRLPIAKSLKAPELTSWLWWIPASILMTGLVQVFSVWIIRKKHFSLLAASKVSSSMAWAGVQVGAGYMTGGGPGGLVAGQLVGQMVGTAILGERVWREDHRNLSKWVRIETMWQQARIYYRFPLLDTWATLANIGAHQLQPLLLNQFFDSTTVGYYFLGYRVLNFPIGFISGSISQVFFQRYEEKRHSSGKVEFLWRNIKFLTLIAFFPGLFLLIFAPMLFKIAFGANWVIAGKYVQILTPMLFFRFIASPLSSVLWSEGKNSWFLLWQISFLIFTVVIFMIGGLLRDINLTLILFSLSSSIIYLVFLYLLIKAASQTGIVKD